jgi:hypothetical protein
MDCIEIFSMFKDFCISGAALTTAYVAYTGLEKWYEELRGKANFEVARELIKNTYRLRDQLKYCRSPFISSVEFPENFDLTKSSNYDKAEAYHHVYSNRFNNVIEVTKEFEVSALEAEALWGATVREKADNLINCIKILNVNINAFIDNFNTDGKDFEADKDFAKAIRSAISDNGKDNKLTNDINLAITSIEKIVIPKLSRK